MTQTSSCQVYNLYPASASPSSQSGTGSFTFAFTPSTVYGGCAIQAYSSQPWISAGLTQSATSGSVNYAVSANLTNSARTGSITVGTSVTSGTAFAISQAASPILISTASLPNGTVGQAYPNTTLAAMGGVSPLIWSASGLPAQLALAAGTISGMPSVAGTFQVTVTVKDSSNPPMSATKTFTISVAAAAVTAASPGDSLIVGPMAIAEFNQVQNLSQPMFANQKYCGLVQLAPGDFAQAYVPTAAEKQGNFSAFAGLLINPFYGGPFPGGIIPASQLPSPWAWRISGYVNTPQTGCANFPLTSVPFNSVYYTSAQIQGGPILITGTTPSTVAAGSGNFTLTLYGRGFSQGTDTLVTINGTTLIPSINLGIELTVSVPGTLISSVGKAIVAVSTPSLGLTSNTVQIPIVSSAGPFLSIGTSSPNKTPTQLQVSGTLGTGTTQAGTISAASTSNSQAVTVQVNVVKLNSTSQNWITVNPTSFVLSPFTGQLIPLATSSSTSQSVVVNLNSAGLAPGSYNALVTLTASSAGSVVDTKTVAVNASFNGVSLIPSTQGLSFNYLVNGLVPGPKTLDLAPVGLSAAQSTFTASSSVITPPGGNWLSISATTGNLPGSINVSVNPGALSPNSYLGQISLTPNGNAPVIVNVALNIKAEPDFQVGFSSYQFGGMLPGMQPAALTSSPNPSGFYLDINSEQNWLQASPLNGETPQTLQLFPVAATLASGIHTGYSTAVDQFDPTNVYMIAASITVPSQPLPLAISSASLPSGTVNQPYPTTTLTATGGMSPLAWNIPAASLPPGLSSQGAMISGTPTSAGTYAVPVTVTDSSTPPLSSSKGFTITIAKISAPQPIINTNGVVSNPTNPGMTTIAPGSWVSIYGSNLAPNDSSGKNWDGLIVSGKLPASIDGVSVTIDNKPAAVNYISSGLINVQAPDDTTTGSVGVTVTTPNGSSASVAVNLATFAPALFALAGSKYAVAQIYPDGANVAPVGFMGLNTRPVKPGDIITLYGTGFGPTSTSAPAGSTVPGAVTLTSLPTATVGGVAANVSYAGLVGAGLNQFTLTVPQVASGDQPLVMKIGGVQTLVTLYLSISN